MVGEKDKIVSSKWLFSLPLENILRLLNHLQTKFEKT